VWRFVADGFVLAFAAPNRIGRASLYHKARLIQINAALIRRVNFRAGGCEELRMRGIHESSRNPSGLRSRAAGMACGEACNHSSPAFRESPSD
jgi:hypothetical protein